MTRKQRRRCATKVFPGLSPALTPAQKPEDEVDRWTRLEFLLKKSAAYAQLLKQRMDLTLQRQRQLEMGEDDSDSEDAPSTRKANVNARRRSRHLEGRRSNWKLMKMIRESLDNLSSLLGLN
jgi:hypothetical protein